MSMFRNINTALMLSVGLALLAGLPTNTDPVAAQTTEVVTLNPSKDNTLYEDPAGSRSNGRGQHLFVGQNNGGKKRRAVIAFDVPGALPAGAAVVSATLSLNLSRTHSGPQPVSLHRVLADWGEGTSDAGGNEGGAAEATRGDATWLHRFYGTDLSWVNPGGDFTHDPSASTAVAARGEYTWGPTPELAADVQMWLDVPDTNFGWLLLGNELTTQTTKRFDSKDHDSARVHPALTIAYTTASAEKVYIYLPALDNR